MLADVAADHLNKCILLLDVTGAFLYGGMQREVAIRLPFELGEPSSSVGLLRKSLYGLRDAPQIWQRHMSSTLEAFGFEHCPTVVGVFAILNAESRWRVTSTTC